MKLCTGEGAHQNPDTAKFCGECGTTCGDVAKAVTADELDSALDVLDSFAKSVNDLDDDLELDDGDDGGQDFGDVVKSVQADDGTIDALPVLDALFKANNAQAGILQAVGREARAARRDLGLVAKSLSVALRQILASEAERGAHVAALAEQPRPRRAQVELVAKAIPGLSASDNSPRGRDLWEAAVSAEIAGKLQAGDATLVQQLTNQGHTLDSITKSVPDLGRRLSGIFTQAA